MLERRPAALSLDLDDTLWPIWPAIEAAEKETMAWFAERCPKLVERFDIPALRELRLDVLRRHPELDHDISSLRRKTFAYALESCGYGDELAREAFEVFFAARMRVTPFDEVMRVLARWRSEYRLVGLTNGNADLAALGMAEFIPEVIRAVEVGRSKPAPEAFRAVQQRVGVPAGEIVHIGDHPEQDVEGARGAGFQVIWLNRDARDWPLDTPPPPTASCLEHAERLLARLPAQLPAR
ncbi:MAG: HAD family hydrolase [Xanthomonadales bacterium]|nr:HAD family hydrolase [Xanthomonadales bacterium]